MLRKTQIDETTNVAESARAVYALQAVLAFGATLVGLDFIKSVIVLSIKLREGIEPHEGPIFHMFAIHMMIWVVPFMIFTLAFGVVFPAITMEIKSVKLRYWLLTGCLCCIASLSMIAVYIVAYNFVKFGNSLMFFTFALCTPMLSAWMGKKFLLWIQKRK